ncbi:TonB-dependent receptor domain-containing protein [Erythrobacter sp. BLCC-B19]|uniref:TonB-dependent receptor domain-containing protein n=1 Tax=Erythrobacter sp. BLCC-B19 TaxID=3025315 RepID=UPI00236259F9|nr:TonB-dependent receptor [Erythrobacter sp. BLCC-B19]WDA41066.1 TonB-dependent receptor [Erythrobacter sp. BLCC-B19]
MRTTKFSLHSSSLPALAAALLFAGFAPAQAQDSLAEEDPAAPPEEQIVVTGSRIARDPNIGSPAPIIAVTAEELQRSGTSDVVDTLRDIPALSTSTTSEGSIDGVFSEAVGQSILNLRGLGSNRTLVLVNGRRHVSGVAGEQAVDINSIPTALIERVETLTGGASSIYGADAVTGVVNFVLKDDFEGLQGNIQSGISSEGDAWRINGDLTWGANFADGRGNITISGEYARNDEVRDGDRSFSRNNGISDDQDNPAIRFQAGDISASATPNFARFYAVGAGGFPTGFSIPSAATFQTRFRNLFGTTPTLTAAELALIERATNAPRRFIAPNPTFSLSAAGGVIAPGDIGLSDGPDINNNGTPDCLESSVGFNSTFNNGAFGLAGGCAVIAADGSLSVYRDGAITGLFNAFGGPGIPNGFNQNSLIPETERYSVNVNLSYELSSEATFFFEGKYVSNTAEFQAQPNTFYDLLTVREDNPYITNALRPFVGELFFGNGTDRGFYITRDPADLGPNRDRNEFETWRFVGGVKGDITDHFAYEISGNYGKFEQTTFDNNRVIMDRWFAAIDAVRAPNGNIVCRSDLSSTPPATTPFGIPAGDPGFFTFNPGDGQCKPANILGGVGAISQEAIDFITTTVVNQFALEQLVFDMVFTGDTGAFLELPGGAIGFATGFEFRKEKSTSTFDPLVLGILPVTTAFGDEGDLLRDLGFAQNSLVFDPATIINNAGGDFTVYDIFGEINVPLLKDVPFAETLDLSAAARYSNYSTVGGTFTWNVGGVYAPIEDITFRGTYAVAVRAPNINELFNPAQGAFFRPFDPCDVNNLATAPDPALRQANCTAFFQQIGFNPNLGGSTYAYVDPLTARFSGTISGNPNLSEETATTWTVGTQLTPSFLPGFILSVDYYNIEIEDAINAVAAQDIVDNCVDSATINNGFCDLITRNPNTGGFTFLRQTSVNFARQETAGVEASMRYSFDIGEHGFRIDAAGTWVDKLDNFFDPGDPNMVDPELGEIQRPEWAARGAFTWDWKGLSLTWSTTWLDKQGLRGVEIEDVGTDGSATFSPDNGLSNDTFIHDIAFGYEASETFEIYGGVNNVFNKKPFVTEQAYPVSPVGTFFFLGVRASM